MDIRQITDTYAVSPQIEPADCAALAEAGFRSVICNRPDGENPPALHAAALREAAEAAGLTFIENPMSGMALSPEIVACQAEALAAADGPVLAYCRSGTRSTVIWAFGAASTLPISEITDAAARAGYDLSGMVPQLELMAKG